MKRRVLLILLAFCFAVTQLPMAVLADEEPVDAEGPYIEDPLEDESWNEGEDEGFENPFPDVPDTADYAEAVISLAAMGVVTGDGVGNFNPNASITRAETATIICRIMGAEDDARANRRQVYDDVPASYWASGYIATATELGVFNGDGTGNFRPNDNVTYEQIIKMLVCACGYEAEAQRNGGWPNGYIAVAEDLGITHGLSFRQTAYAPRRAVAQLTYNLMQF